MTYLVSVFAHNAEIENCLLVENNSIIAEYQAQEQRSLPFKELGFPTLEAFMRSITDTVYIEYNLRFIFLCVAF